MTQKTTLEIDDFQKLVKDFQIRSHKLLPTTRREFLLATVALATVTNSASAFEEEDEATDRPRIIVSFDQKYAEITFQEHPWIFDASWFGRDCVIKLLKGKDSYTLIVSNAVEPEDQQPFHPIFQIFLQDNRWYITAKLRDLTTDNRYLFETDKPLDLLKWMKGEKNFEVTFNLSSTQNFLARLTKDAVILAPRVVKSKAPAKILLTNDGHLLVKARYSAYKHRLKEAFYLPDANGSTDQILLLIDPYDPVPDKANTSHSNTLNFDLLNPDKRHILLLAKLKFESPLYLARSEDSIVSQNTSQQADLEPRENHHWISDLQNLPATPVMYSIPFEEYTDDNENNTARKIIYSIEADQNEERHKLSFFTSTEKHPQDIKKINFEEPTREYLNDLSLIFGPVFLESLNVYITSKNRKFKFNAIGNIGYIARPHDEVIFVGNSSSWWKKRYRLNSVSIASLNGVEKCYSVKSSLGPIRAAFSEIDKESIKGYHFDFSAQSELVETLSARLPILTIPASVEDADFSRLDFKTTTLDVNLSIAQEDQQSDVPSYDPDAEKKHGKLQISRAASLSLPLDDALLKVRRSQDLLALDFSFRLLTLHLNSKGIFIRPAMAIDQEEDTEKFPHLSNEVKPALIVGFPPQHVAEQAYFRTTRDGSLNAEEASGAPNFPDVTVDQQAAASPDTPADKKPLEIEALKSFQSPEYFYFKELFQAEINQIDSGRKISFSTILSDYYPNSKPTEIKIKKRVSHQLEVGLDKNYLGREDLFANYKVKIEAAERAAKIYAAEFSNTFSNRFAHVTEARLSGMSRMVFHVGERLAAPVSETAILDNHRHDIRFNLVDLTNWENFDLIVSRRAERFEYIADYLDDTVEFDDDADSYERMQARRKSYLEFQKIKADSDWLERMRSVKDAASKKPKAWETSIELPFRMNLSPESAVVVRSRQKPFLSEYYVRPLWKAELEQKQLDERRGIADVRAIWSDDFEPEVLKQADDDDRADQPTMLPVPPWSTVSTNKSFLNSLSKFDRHQLVHLSSVHGLPAVPRIVDRDGNPATKGSESKLDANQFPVPEDYKLDTQTVQIGKTETQVMYDPQPLGVRELSLTSLGANLDLEAKFEPPAPIRLRREGSDNNLYYALSVERWKQKIALGRDIETEVVYKGFLYPFGMRAALIKRTTREIHNRTGETFPRAYLVQRMFLKVGKPDKDFPAINQRNNGRKWPVDKLTLLTTQTPFIQNPLADEAAVDVIVPDNNNGTCDGLFSITHGGRLKHCGQELRGLAFWPRTGRSEGSEVKFEFTIDESGETVKLPLMFVDNGAAHEPETVKRLEQFYKALAEQEWSRFEPDYIDNNKRILDKFFYTIVGHRGVKRRYADEEKSGDATLKTLFWHIGVEGRTTPIGTDVDTYQYQMNDPAMEGADQPPFYPTVDKAHVISQQIERLTGTGSAAGLTTFADVFVRAGFDDKVNPTSCILEYIKDRAPTMQLSSNESGAARGDRAGGIGQPNTNIKYYCREFGPTGDIDKAGSESAAIRHDRDRQFALADQRNPEVDYDLITGSTTTNFNIGDFFNDSAKFLGIINFKDLFALDNVSKDMVPNLRELVNYDAIDEDVENNLLAPIYELFVKVPHIGDADCRSSEGLEEFKRIITLIRDIYSNIGKPADEIEKVIAAWCEEKTKISKIADDQRRAEEKSQNNIRAISQLVRPLSLLIKEIKISSANPVAPLRTFLENFILDNFSDLLNGFINQGNILSALVNVHDLQEKLWEKLVKALCRKELRTWCSSALGIPVSDDFDSIDSKLGKLIDDAFDETCNILESSPPEDLSSFQNIANQFRTHLKEIVEQQIQLELDNLSNAGKERIRNYEEDLKLAIDAQIDGPLIKRLEGFWKRLYNNSRELEQKIDELRRQPRIETIGEVVEVAARTAIETFKSDAENELYGIASALGGYVFDELQSEFKTLCKDAANIIVQSIKGGLSGDLNNQVERLGEFTKLPTAAINKFMEELGDGFGGKLPEGAKETREYLDKEIKDLISKINGGLIGISSNIGNIVSEVSELAEVIDDLHSEVSAPDFAETFCTELANGQAVDTFRTVQRISLQLRVLGRKFRDGIGQIWLNGGNGTNRKLWSDLLNKLANHEAFFDGLETAVSADIANNVSDLDLADLQPELDEAIEELTGELATFIADNTRYITLGSNIAEVINTGKLDTIEGVIKLLEGVKEVAKKIEDPGGDIIAKGLGKLIETVTDVQERSEFARKQIDIVNDTNAEFQRRAEAAQTLLQQLPGGSDTVNAATELMDQLERELTENVWQFIVGAEEIANSLIEFLLPELRPVFEVLHKVESKISTLRNETVSKIGKLTNDPKEKKALLDLFLALIFFNADEVTPADNIAKLFWVKNNESDIPNNLFTGGPANIFPADQLGREVQKLKSLQNSLNSNNVTSAVQNIQEIWGEWREDNGTSGSVLIRQLVDEIARIRKADLSQFVDFDEIRRQLEDYFLQMVPSRVDLGYSFAAGFSDNEFIMRDEKGGVGNLAQIPQLVSYLERQDFSPGSGGVNLTGGVSIASFLKNTDHRFMISARASVDILKPKKPEFRVNAIVKPFKLKLLGNKFHAVTITFHGAAFETKPDGSSGFYTRIADVEIGPQLEFLQKLASVMNPGKSGPFIKPVFSPLGIEVGYSISIGTVPFGGLIFSNIFFSAGCILPFDRSRAKFTIALSSRLSPFLISAPPYGGGGFMRIVADAKSIVSLEASLEFGGVAPFTFGVLEGQGRITAGFYIRHGQITSYMEGFLFAGGAAQVACFGIAASLFIGLGSSDKGSMKGVAIFKFSFSVGFLDVEFEVKAEHEQKGGHQSAFLITPANAPVQLAFLFDEQFYQKHARDMGGARVIDGHIMVAGDLDHLADIQPEDILARSHRCGSFSSTKDIRNDQLTPHLPVRVVAANCKGEDWIAHSQYFHTDLLQSLDGL